MSERPVWCQNCSHVAKGADCPLYKKITDGFYGKNRILHIQKAAESLGKLPGAEIQQMCVDATVPRFR